MKILHLNSFDNLGGSSRATYRLHRALLNKGVNSVMYVQYKELMERTIYSNERPLDKLKKQAKSYLEKLFLNTFYKWDNTVFSPGLFAENINDIIDRFKPDILNLNWVTGGFLNVKSISKIKVPSVWTMHDSWVFTGGCHLPYNCTKYQDFCGSCPKLNSTKAHDISYKQLRLKHHSWSGLKISYVTPSHWLYTCAKQSSLLADKDVRCIPNGIDTEFFKPIDRNNARDILNISRNKKYILFGSVNSLSDTNKGFLYIQASLKRLKELTKEDIELLVFGAGEPAEHFDLSYKTHFLGEIHDQLSLKVIYAAADIVLVPSKSENLSYIIMESMSMGTPVVAFDIGGNSDLIDQGINGYLARPFDSEDLANGLNYIIQNQKYDQLSYHARMKVLSNFDINNIVVNKYLELYKEKITF
jgi:glycosyltransferase involved in cell wall biosynthesis